MGLELPGGDDPAACTHRALALLAQARACRGWRATTRRAALLAEAQVYATLARQCPHPDVTLTARPLPRPGRRP